MLHFIRRFMVIFILLASSMPSYANEISHQLTVAITQIEYLIEDPIAYDFSQVSQIDDSDWSGGSEYPLNLGNLESGAWGRFKLKNVEDGTLERILEFANPRLHRLSVFVQHSSGLDRHWHLGGDLPYSEREIMFRNFSLPIELKAQEEVQVYFRAESNVGLLLPIFLHKEAEFWRLANNESISYGLYFGILLMFVIFNISLYLARNNYLFVLLAIDLSVFGLMYANHLGLNFEYLWPVDSRFNYMASLFLGYLVILAANVFTWHFLRLKKSKILNKIYYAFNAMTVLGVVLLWLIPAEFSSYLCAVLGVAVALYLSFLTMLNRQAYTDYSYYYIASYGIAALATCIYIMHKLAILPTNFITNNAIGGSILLQAIVLTSVLLEREKVVEKIIGFSSQNQAVADSARDWIAQFSHEVRTPLNGIIGMADLLKETPLNPTQFGYIRTLSSSGKYLLDLVSAELDYDNLSRGAVELNEDVFDFNLLCQQCCEMFEQQASDSEVTITVELSQNMPVVFYGDEKCLKQIIINLLSNSIKFTHQGRIVVRANYLVGESSEVSRHDANKLILTVWDDGIGISRQQQLKIFDRYHQTDSSTYSGYGGNGLGLAICRQLTHLMGGEISVASRVGEYSSFTVELPLACSQKKANGTEKAIDFGKSAVRKQAEDDSQTLINRELVVLGVDDNEINRRVLKAMLNKLGHRMVEAASAQEAINIVKSGTALDLILMDCEMPKMNGFEATKIIRKWQGGQAGKACPIVALTAHVLTEHIEQCLEAGMDDHLSKPLHLKELSVILESIEGH